MDLKDLDKRALASTAKFVVSTRHDQLGADTPCEGWDVRALLNHVIGGNELYAAAAAGNGVDWATREDDRVGNDPRSAYDRSAAAVTAQFVSLDLRQGEVELPFGRLPASHAVAVHFVDVLMHGWDLAVATGQDPTLDPELCTTALEMVAAYPPEVWGDPKFFAHKISVDDSAQPHERLAATLGRQPL